MDSETLNFILAIANSIMALGAIGSLIFVGCQVLQVKKQIIETRKEFMSQNNRNSMERAVDLARYYQEEIVPLLRIVTCVFNKVHLTENLNIIDETKMIKFDSKEMKAIVSNDLITKFEKTFDSDALGTAYKDHLTSISSANKIKIDVESNDTLDEESQEMITQAIFKEDLDGTAKQDIVSFQTTINDLLNKVEYFSMNFSCNIACEDVLYQSLHQSFRSIMKLLYIRISKINNDPLDKYFTHTISLYNTWNDKYFQKTEITEKAHEECITNPAYEPLPSYN